MRKIKLFSVFVLLALLLSTAPVAVLAQEPLPPREPVPPSGLPEVSDMVVTESSGIELVTKQTEAGEVQVPVTVNRVEAVQTANIHGQTPRKDAMGTRGATSGSAGGVTVTMWRAIGYYYTEPPNHYAHTGARTRTSQCVQAVKVLARHKYWGPSGGPYWGWEKSGSDVWGCRNDTNQQWTGYILFANGTTHQAVAKHEVKVNDQWYRWLGPDGQGERGPTKTL